MPHQNCERQSRCKILVTLFHSLLVIALLDIKLPTVNAVPTVGEDAATGAGVPAGNEEKRNWQALQGPWGKRAAHYGTPLMPETIEQEEDERLVPLLISNGEREEPFLKYSMMYLTNAGTLDRLLNDRQQEEQNGLRYNDDLLTSIEENEGFTNNNNNNDDNALLTEKRAWNKMNAAWGKRRNAPTWNKFRGAWGKREPGWNNLKGMWGKRASKDWGKLHGGWGKRALN
ncbi:allatostatins MIP-like [Rhagoletis pomonella]|uniref:allatostatins MIP-like n=1 Tax=Rhagoletis pomonella TaxID=28610 RepID=UPI001787573D|nr:allatostatins MIP-like [Rhagoletis pomonella]